MHLVMCYLTTISQNYLQCLPVSHISYHHFRSKVIFRYHNLSTRNPEDTLLGNFHQCLTKSDALFTVNTNQYHI